MGRISYFLFAAPLLVYSISAMGQGPNVFIDGNGSEQEAARMTTTVHRDDQTMELARDLLKSCPDISITREENSSPDYFLLLNRGEERGGLRLASSQVMLLDGQKNVLYSSKEGTVARAARDGCKAILVDWKKRRAAVSPKSEPPKNWWQTTTPQEKKR
jgi:hypothetical protein